MYGGVYNEIKCDTYFNDVEPPSISSCTRRCRIEAVTRIIKAAPRWSSTWTCPQRWNGHTCRKTTGTQEVAHSPQRSAKAKRPVQHSTLTNLQRGKAHPQKSRTPKDQHKSPHSRRSARRAYVWWVDPLGATLLIPEGQTEDRSHIGTTKQ